MAFKATRVALVGNAVAVLVATAGGPVDRNTRVEINNTSANTVYIGASNATAAASSRTIPTATTVVFELRPDETMYAFATVNSTIEVTADGQ